MPSTSRSQSTKSSSIPLKRAIEILHEDENGQRLRSYKEIARLLKRRTGHDVNPSTIYRWAKEDVADPSTAAIQLVQLVDRDAIRIPVRVAVSDAIFCAPIRFMEKENATDNASPLQISLDEKHGGVELWHAVNDGEANFAIVSRQQPPGIRGIPPHVTIVASLGKGKLFGLTDSDDPHVLERAHFFVPMNSTLDQVLDAHLERLLGSRDTLQVYRLPSDDIPLRVNNARERGFPVVLVGWPSWLGEIRRKLPTSVRLEPMEGRLRRYVPSSAPILIVNRESTDQTTIRLFLHLLNHMLQPESLKRALNEAKSKKAKWLVRQDDNIDRGAAAILDALKEVELTDDTKVLLELWESEISSPS